MAQVRTSTNFRAANRAIADELVRAIYELREYWPLTVRQAFYQMVARLVVPNSKAEYKKISDILLKLRRQGRVPWSAIEDRTRRTTEKRGHSDYATWLRDQLNYFADARCYGRCYVQDQDVYVEVSTEKDALASIVEDVTWKFCTRLNIVRGQNSGSFQQVMAERFKRAEAQGQRPILIHVGDFDPSGVAIPKSMAKSFREDHGVEVEVIRAALNPDQIIEHQLPAKHDAAKQTDPNYKEWLRLYGEDQVAVELDALHPKTLQDIVSSALSDVLDMSSMEIHKRIEAEEYGKIRRIKVAVEDFLASEFPDVFNAPSHQFLDL